MDFLRVHQFLIGHPGEIDYVLHWAGRPTSVEYYLDSTGQARTDTDNFSGSNSPQLVVAERKSRSAELRYNRLFSYSPIPRRLCCGEPSFQMQSLCRFDSFPAVVKVFMGNLFALPRMINSKIVSASGDIRLNKI